LQDKGVGFILLVKWQRVLTNLTSWISTFYGLRGSKMLRPVVFWTTGLMWVSLDSSDSVKANLLDAAVTTPAADKTPLQVSG
jgi:hypothetical protein